MKCFYVEAQNDNKEYVWIKFVLNKPNEFTLRDIIKSVNQYLINTNPTDVFFTYPNILFVEENSTLYRNYSKDSKVKFITTIDIDEPTITHTFSTFHTLKEVLLNLVYCKGGE